jgi:hypothetical protein
VVWGFGYLAIRALNNRTKGETLPRIEALYAEDVFEEGAINGHIGGYRNIRAID